MEIKWSFCQSRKQYYKDIDGHWIMKYSQMYTLLGRKNVALCTDIDFQPIKVETQKSKRSKSKRCLFRYKIQMIDIRIKTSNDIWTKAQFGSAFHGISDMIIGWQDLLLNSNRCYELNECWDALQLLAFSRNSLEFDEKTLNLDDDDCDETMTIFCILQRLLWWECIFIATQTYFHEMLL